MPATITPSVSNVGNKTGRDIINYTVTAQAGTTITRIEEKVVGQVVNVFTNPASLSRTFTIPQVQFDALRFFYRHTLEVVVTDSTGQATVATYLFTKALASNASLQEAAKAVEDARVLLNQKRSTISSLVGLGNVGSFDQIITQLSNGVGVKKFASGTAVSGSAAVTLYNTLNENDTTTRRLLVVSGLAFAPRSIQIYDMNGIPQSSVSLDAPKIDGTPAVLLGGSNASYFLNGALYTTQSGFALPVAGSGVTYYWEVRG